MREIFLIALTLAAAPAYGRESALPEPFSSDSRMKMLTYDESDVYTITTRYGYQTNIVFSPGEDIHTISVGDRSLWQIIPTANRLFIRPMEEGVTTNMTIITNKHAYQFDLKSVSANKPAGVIYVAQFIYPDEKKKEIPVSEPPPSFLAASPATHSPAPFLAAAPVTPSPAPPPASSPVVNQPVFPNYHYTYAGPDALAPLQVYDDGKSTYIKYRDHVPLPEIYVMGPDGKPRPVTYYMQQEALVVDMVTPEFLLTSGAGNVHIYNENAHSR